MAMASFIRVLKSSAVIVESTLSMASFSSVLPFNMHKNLLFI